MTSRRKKPAEQPPLLVAATDVVGTEQTAAVQPQNRTVTESGGPGADHAFVGYYPRTTQLELANRLARAREDGEREGRIAQACEDAGAARFLAEEMCGTLDANACAAIRGAGDGILSVLRHRYKGNRDAEARIEYHCKMRGLM